MKNLIKKLLHSIGFNVVRIQNKYGIDPFLDMSGLVKHDHPMIFDVGANEGQTIRKFHRYFKKGTIHAFEPNSDAYAILKQQASKMNEVHIWNSGLGATIGQSTFFENSMSTMSSFLKLGETGWGNVKESTAEVTTVDQFCAEQNIAAIDVLKIDTQGFELEVLKGAEDMLSNQSIGLIYLEVTFSKMYENLPSMGDLYNFLCQKGYKLVSIYKMYYQNNLAGWTDLLFVHESYTEEGKSW